jgi:hypothetical protein
MRIGALDRLARMGFGIACGLAPVVLAAGASGLGAPLSSSAQPATRVSPSPPPGPPAPPTRPASGLIAVLPGDGIAEEAARAGIFADPGLAAALSTSDEGLVEEALPEGGVRVRLEGRFRNVLFATVSPGGIERSHRQPMAVLFAPGPESGPQVCRPASPGEEAHDAAR